ncbi:3-hydroxyacyl-CoA dehydrogenase family protein [Aspergillus glaucus CBS 516.65]|uniref:3-hydroxyacyl-CoA dehydrogenase NAD binding domain-containing protein n=1 Tax=Aspergillus glaucus CBS 516.65 TaxID=1160497 RepID=A0A1L9VJS2_ASPGL|nr:hypothetical protein ASPGLDRAFT_171175 [Aspergillus glaucus CBS 516.65]OJJ84167.1 hypothetical protein ASPGLDRAFT_171175 [Aspergillus glaucus CBS 516.65]
MSTWNPQDYRTRPVTILGGGVLGRRVACVWSSAGYATRIFDPSPDQRQAAITYITENAPSYAQRTAIQPNNDIQAFDNLGDAVSTAWLVIEAVPEKLALKIDTFAELATLAPADCILASNSSSYKTSEMLEKIAPEAEARTRILNTHYYMPPGNMIVELMTNGHTSVSIFPFLVERSREAALVPYVARKESTGFIFNRLWAAVKREALMVLAEGVSEPEEIDDMWKRMFVEGAAVPCAMMDNVGLDTVAFIEEHYVKERGLSGEKTVDFLREKYLEKGRLGSKCEKGGLYPPAS